MKLCAAQTKPIRGDIATNIANHKTFIKTAAFNKANIIIFPELSITGYEPGLAGQLAIERDSPVLDEFQTISDSKSITIGVGMPLKNESGISISMLLFQPFASREVYSKKYLHADEEPFFVSGESSITLLPGNVACAICYEISVPAHAENAFRSGAGIYLASVAKTQAGVQRATAELSAIAAKYRLPVLMANCVGHCDDFDCAGQSAAWKNGGEMAGALDDKEEGLLIFDTETGDVQKIPVK